VTDNPVALAPLPPRVGQQVVLLWTGRGGVALALHGEPAVVLAVRGGWLEVATAEGGRRVRAENVG
jgi:hypothetical protein